MLAPIDQPIDKAHAVTHAPLLPHIASMVESHANQSNTGARRPFSFQIPPDAPQSQTLTPINTTQQAQHAPGDQREWAGYPEQRFSYLETPIDENTQTFDDERQAALLEEARRRFGELNSPSQPATPQPQPQSAVPEQPPADARFPPEKQDITRVPSAYQQAPPPQQHPAFASPVTEPPPTHIPEQQPDPPLSPGPLPLKDEHDFPPARPRPQAYSVQPDGHTPVFGPPPGSHFSTFSGDGALASTIHASAGAGTAPPVFTHGLCACPGSDLSTCCVGLFCPCILYSKLQYRLARRSKRGNPTDLLGWDKCDSSCIGFAALSLCGLCGILAGIARGRVRRAYGIEGGAGGDCIEGCCCCCCAVIQGEREIRVREEERSKGASTWNATEAYQRQSGMAYQPHAM